MNRPVGIFYAYWVREWDADFLPFIERAKRLGFDQVELHAAILAERDSADRKQIKEEAQKVNIRLSFGMGLEKQYDVSSPDEETRKRGVVFVKKIIQGVAEMGGGMISGTVHSYWPAIPPEGMTDKRPMLEQSIKSMRELAPFAGDHGVMLNVEVINRFEQFLVNTSAEAVAYVNEVNNPACNILLDTFHMNIEEDSIGDAIRLAGKRLAALHLGEPNRKLPGMGRMNWTEIKQALDDINFSGPLVMEPFIVPGGTVGRHISIWRELFPAKPDMDALARDSCEFVKRTLR